MKLVNSMPIQVFGEVQREKTPCCNRTGGEALTLSIVVGLQMPNKITKSHLSRLTPEGGLKGRGNTPPLSDAVREHLGRTLRADYYERGDKPRYLGDPALPAEFDVYLSRLEQKERALRTMRIREHGMKAVAKALSNLNL